MPTAIAFRCLHSVQPGLQTFPNGWFQVYTEDTPCAAVLCDPSAGVQTVQRSYDVAEVRPEGVDWVARHGIDKKPQSSLLDIQSMEARRPKLEC